MARLAFTQKVDGQWDLYTSALDGTDRQRVTNDPQREVSPLWSPGGDVLAFSYAASNAPLGWAETEGLFILSAGGKGPTQIATGVVEEPAFSSDGTLISYTGAERDSFFCGLKVPTIRVVASNSGNSLMEMPGAFPVWIPGQQQLVFLSAADMSDSNAQPAIADIRTGEITPLAPQLGFPFTASPDGRHLYWIMRDASEKNDDDTLVETGTDGLASQNLSALPGGFFNYFLTSYAGCSTPREPIRSWSADGTRLIIWRNPESLRARHSNEINTDLAQMELAILDIGTPGAAWRVIPYRNLLSDNPASMRPTSDTMFGIENAVWLPDGESIIYSVAGGPRWFPFAYAFETGKRTALFPDIPSDQFAFVACCGH
ncbi:MAG TPA: hypothetical protein VG757_04055 [Devosia sp.]|nr:hypothetical protein [Devosia sp.]